MVSDRSETKTLLLKPPDERLQFRSWAAIVLERLGAVPVSALTRRAPGGTIMETVALACP